MNTSEITKYLILRTIGNFLLLFALYGVGATFGPALYYEAQYQVIKYRGVTFAVAEIEHIDVATRSAAVNPSIGFGQILSGSKEQILTPSDTDFSILIPKIGASAKIFPNIDPEKSEEFVPILTQGVAHAKGTVFPGMKGNTYLFAHSTDSFWNVGRYNAIFYLLKDLKKDDDITLFFEGRRYDYTVEEQRVGEANEVQFLTDAHTTEEKLILQTCWPPGTTWKRIYVTAVPKKG